MTTKLQRPRFLDLLKIHMPVGAVASFGHRISGLLLVLSIPFGLYLLDLSLRSPQGFAQVAHWLTGIGAHLLLILLGWLLFHHLLGGIRYLAIDMDWGVARDTARRSAWGVLAGGILLGLLMGLGL